MKMRLTIDLDVDSNIAGQVKRNGLSLVKSGRYLRTKVGEHLIACNEAKVTIEDISDDGKADPAQRQNGG